MVIQEGETILIAILQGELRYREARHWKNWGLESGLLWFDTCRIFFFSLLFSMQSFPFSCYTCVFFHWFSLPSFSPSCIWPISPPTSKHTSSLTVAYLDFFLPMLALLLRLILPELLHLGCFLGMLCAVTMSHFSSSIILLHDRQEKSVQQSKKTEGGKRKEKHGSDTPQETVLEWPACHKL